MQGYWHHNGWVFKYVGKNWYRFQGHKWVRYGATVKINPTPPRGKKICRPFRMLKKFGFPGSLSSKRLPRCKVGTGKSSVLYMWKDRAACRFLGGRLSMQKRSICKVGRPHQWARVIRCVRGPILSKKGLNYKTGRSSRSVRRTKTVGVYQDKRAVKIAKSYADINSGAKTDFQVTKISSATKNCFSLGEYAVNGYKAPSKSIMHRYCTNAKNVKTVFRKPQSFTKGWDTTGIKRKTKNGSIWLPNCPKGFRALGHVAIQIENGKKVTSANFPGFRCIADKYT